MIFFLITILSLNHFYFLFLHAVRNRILWVQDETYGQGAPQAKEIFSQKAKTPIPIAFYPGDH